jgi:predicted nuclease of predicted toxin-antitoxin system
MKLLIDANISYKIVGKIKSIFPDSLHVNNEKVKLNTDIEIWKYSNEHDFAILTYDADFYDIGLLKGSPPIIIWIRRGNLTISEITELLFINQLKIQNLQIESNKTICFEIL